MLSQNNIVALFPLHPVFFPEHTGTTVMECVEQWEVDKFCSKQEEQGAALSTVTSLRDNILCSVFL